jgi:hypothetical protein
MKRALVAFLPLALLLCEPCMQGAVAGTLDSTEAPSRFVGLDTTSSGSPDASMAVTIQGVCSTHTPGTPAGTLLSVSNPGGPLLISVGPYLTQEMLQSLGTGTRVEVTGKMLDVHGQNYFFARQLVVEGQQIVIRNNNGSLVRHLSHPHANSQTSKNGELQ